VTSAELPALEAADRRLNASLYNEVEKSNLIGLQQKVAAIESDPELTPEQKEAKKESKLRKVYEYTAIGPNAPRKAPPRIIPPQALSPETLALRRRLCAAQNGLQPQPPRPRQSTTALSDPPPPVLANGHLTHAENGKQMNGHAAPAVAIPAVKSDSNLGATVAADLPLSSSTDARAEEKNMQDLLLKVSSLNP